MMVDTEKERKSTSTNNAHLAGSYATTSVSCRRWCGSFSFFLQAVRRNVVTIRAKVRAMDTRRVAGRESGGGVVYYSRDVRETLCCERTAVAKPNTARSCERAPKRRLSGPLRGNASWAHRMHECGEVSLRARRPTLKCTNEIYKNMYAVYLVRREWTCEQTRPTSLRRSWTSDITKRQRYTAANGSTDASMSRRRRAKEKIFTSRAGVSHAYAGPTELTPVWLANKTDRVSPRASEQGKHALPTARPCERAPKRRLFGPLRGNASRTQKMHRVLVCWVGDEHFSTESESEVRCCQAKHAPQTALECGLGVRGHQTPC